MIYKRGPYYWYNFWFNGQHIQVSTKQRSPVAARQMEAARRTALAKGEVGIVERKRAPSLKEFGPRFLGEVTVQRREKPNTIRFYAEKMARLLEFEPLASASLDDIDEAKISEYTQYRQQSVSPKTGRTLSTASVNRELATLRRLLRLAYTWKIIGRVPTITLQGETGREFILTHKQEQTYLDAAPQPLRDLAVLLLDTGLRVGEAVELRWTDIRMTPATGARYGYLHVKSGKSRNAKRNLPLTARVNEMLSNRHAGSESLLVFPGKIADRPLLVTSCDHEHTKVREQLGMPTEFVLHSLRHSMLSRLGEAGTDTFTLMRIAGHSSITTSQNTCIRLRLLSSRPSISWRH